MTKAIPERAGLPLPADDDPVAIAVRAYVERAKKAKPQKRERLYYADGLKPSNVVLVFDTETYLYVRRFICEHGAPSWENVLSLRLTNCAKSSHCSHDANALATIHERKKRKWPGLEAAR
jgi:hypothetical protein